ncbi:MAG: hypothetical protein ACI9FN_001460 [Saprospiraceae bacterium]|jgi:hypothetical protein
MKLFAFVLLLTMWFSCGCESEKRIEDWSKEEINALLSNFDVADPAFVEKDIQFDSILTIAGIRKIGTESQRIKCKLFFFGTHMRGYFNLADQDDKNLQVFGKRIDKYIAFKSATKINMEESDGFLILDENYKGIWSNGNINFKNGTISMTKQKTDYTSLESW